MEFQRWYNQVDKKRQDSKDCTVYALAIATGIGYEKAYEFMKNNGRKDNEGAPFFHTINSNLNSKNELFGYKWEYIRFPYWDFQREATGKTRKKINYWGEETEVPILTPRKNLKTFIKENPTGNFIIGKRGHVFVVKDGIVIDNDLQPYTEIISVFKLTPIENE